MLLASDHWGLGLQSGLGRLNTLLEERKCVNAPQLVEPIGSTNSSPPQPVPPYLNRLRCKVRKSPRFKVWNLQ